MARHRETEWLGGADFLGLAPVIRGADRLVERIGVDRVVYSAGGRPVLVGRGRVVFRADGRLQRIGNDHVVYDPSGQPAWVGTRRLWRRATG